LQKSVLVEFKVVNSSDQIETQSKSLSAIAIPLAQDTKDFQLTENMLNHNPFPSQSAISLFFSLRQSVVFGFLDRCLAVFMKFCQALVPSICQDAKVFGKITAIVLEQLKIVFAPITESCGDNLGTLSVSNYLRFLGVTLLFATVMPFLTFFGRSIGCSLTSTNMTSNTVSLDWSTFLPGNRNLPERTKAFSTFWMVRQTVASLMP
jgi:hypothetical protein